MFCELCPAYFDPDRFSQPRLKRRTDFLYQVHTSSINTYYVCMFCFLANYIEAWQTHIDTQIMYTLTYLYSHSSSDKESVEKGPGRHEKGNKEAFEDEGSLPHRTELLYIVVYIPIGKVSYRRFDLTHRLEHYILMLSYNMIFRGMCC